MSRSDSIDERLRRIRDQAAYERIVRVYHDAIDYVDSDTALRFAFDALVSDFVDFLARCGLSEDIQHAILNYPFEAARSSGRSSMSETARPQEPTHKSSSS